MFFEGSEKKIELIVTSEVASLRQLPASFWRHMVAKAQAEILSVVSNDMCDAYLLSESSLFVWDNRLLMLTCGSTTLVHAANYFITHFDAASLAFVSYQRKNEYLPHLQSTAFADDLALLRQHIDGKAYRVGHLDSHHHYIFYSTCNDTTSNDMTHELLMYHIGGDAAQYLRSEGQTLVGVRQCLQLQSLFSDFVIDDFLFEPFGYSVNGIRGNEYFTIHITPQENSSYVSFETNIDLAHYDRDVIAVLLQALTPGSWDTISVNCSMSLAYSSEHVCISHCDVALPPRYTLTFRHFQRPAHALLQPAEL